MNKYIYGVCDNDTLNYNTIFAKSLNDAKYRIVQRYYNDYEWDCPEDWDEFLEYAYRNNFIIGDPIDIETL